MKQPYEKQIKKATKGLSCPKHIKCSKLPLEKLCKTEKVGIEVFFKCWQKNSRKCKNSLQFGELRLCECSVRYHIKNKLEEFSQCV